MLQHSIHKFKKFIFSTGFLLPTICTAGSTAFPIKETRSNGIPCPKHGAVKAKNASPHLQYQ